MTIDTPTQIPMGYRHIVAAITGSSFFEETFRTASLIADASGAQLHVVHVNDGRTATERDMRSYLERHADEALRTAGLEWLAGDLDDPAASIERFTRSLDHGIACVGCHGYRGPDLAFGSVTEELLLRDRPLLVVGPNTTARTPRRVAVCLDGSAWAETMLEEGARWAAALSAPLWVVQALPPSAADTRTDVVESSYLRRAVAPWQHLGVDVAWDTVHDRHPDRALLGWLNEELGTLTVAATHGRSGMQRAMLGGVANHLVRESLGPLVLRRPNAQR